MSDKDILSCCKDPFHGNGCCRAASVCCCSPCIQGKLFARTREQFLCFTCCTDNQCCLTSFIFGVDAIPIVGPCIVCGASANLRHKIVNNVFDESKVKSWAYSLCCYCCSLYQLSALLKDKDEDMTNPCAFSVAKWDGHVAMELVNNQSTTQFRA